MDPTTRYIKMVNIVNIVNIVNSVDSVDMLGVHFDTIFITRYPV